MDRRMTVYRAIAECRALDTANDVLALSQEGRLHLVAAHSAHVQNDWGRYLDAVDHIDRTFRDIRDTARLWADQVVAAPMVAPDQIALHLVA